MKKKEGLKPIFFSRNKRGQFFLIAAVIIIVAVVSIVTVSNYTQKKEVIKLYDLGEELGIESQHVLDYGTYNDLDEEEMKNLMLSFISNYVNYIDEENVNLYFIFGDEKKINVVGYQDIAEEVRVCFEESESDCPILKTIGGDAQEFEKEGGGTISIVIIEIGNEEYPFKLSAAQNFYFVIWQEQTAGKIVITSEDV